MSEISEKKERGAAEQYERTQMQKELILRKLKESGCRITRQRRMLLDIILEEDCTCCKEIYYRASSLDENIGTATVYRMINTLEEIGALNRRNMYKICDVSDGGEHGSSPVSDVCRIEFEDHTILEVSRKKWEQIIQTGLTACGYTADRKVRKVTTAN